MRTLITIILLSTSTMAMGQSADSVILRAMKDELDRNMNELRYEGFEKPFYISYGVDDVHEYQAAATMGALMQSGEKQNRTKNIRVLVGDYEFNDESLDNSSFSPPEADEIAMPLDNDYFGIRRSLWVTTDHIYKSAARQYKKNLETLKEKNKTLAEMVHRTFASQPVVNIRQILTPYKIKLSEMEWQVKEMSAIFNDYPSIEYSSAFVSFYDGNAYFMNSEGTVSVTPYRAASISVYAQRKTDEGETIHDQILHQAFTPDQLPSMAKLKDQIRALCESLIAEPLKVLDEEYSGPVMVVGQPVAEVLGRTFFASRDALTASDVIPDPRGYTKQDQTSSIDSKIGKLIVHESITVKAKPMLKEYQGLPLLGAYQIDREGVVPKDELLLVERGILRNLLNDRTLIKAAERASGHSQGPGVVEITVSGAVSMNTLKEQLIAEAKRQGLEYALLIQRSGADPTAGAVVNRIWVKDGKVDLLRGGILQSLNLKDLKNMVGASNSVKAYNLATGDQQGVSYIVPEAIMLKDVEVTKAEIRLMKEEHYVTSPLKMK